MKTDIIETGPEFLQFERMPVSIFTDHEELSLRVAQEIAQLIKERTSHGKRTVLGLITGTMIVGVYREWIRMNREEGLDFRNVVVFNLGEYFPISPDGLQSNARFLRENLLDHINIPDTQIHLLRGDIPRSQVEKACKDFEKAIRAEDGIDVQLLEAGRMGHIGFNEPGTLPGTRTRLVTLDEATRKEAAADFFSEENVPEFAITMGMGTLMEARHIYVVAIGEGKASLVRKIVEEDTTSSVPASYLQGHPAVSMMVDLGAAGSLTRIRKPWLLGDVTWTPELEYRAVLQLSEETGNALSKLENTDYNRL